MKAVGSASFWAVVSPVALNQGMAETMMAQPRCVRSVVPKAPGSLTQVNNLTITPDPAGPTDQLAT